MATLEFELESLVLELVDPKPETVDLGLELVAPGPEVAKAVVDYNCKDFDTQGAAGTHMCWHQTPNDTLLDS